MSRTTFTTELARAGVTFVITRTYYCRDAQGWVVQGCKGHHEARVRSCHIDIARNVCDEFNNNGACQSASVHM